MVMMLWEGVIVVVALGPCSQSAPLLGPEAGGRAVRKAVPHDRPQDLAPHVHLLWAFCLHAPCLHPLPWHAPALQAFLALQPPPQTVWLYLVFLGR